MTRVKRGNVARKRRKILNQEFRGSHSTLFDCQSTSDEGAAGAYRDRKSVSVISAAWITRINAAARQMCLSYSQLMGNLKKANIELNRKMLAQMAVLDPASFSKVAELAKAKG